MEFLAAKRAALRRQRLGDAAAAIVEAHTPPVVVSETKQRAQQARDAAAKRAERQNTFVAGVLASVSQEVTPQPQKKKHKLCPHEKRQYYCVECDGAGICKEHKRIRYSCKECCRATGRGRYCS
jgi:excinuclease UvrABC ATPase subunit